MREGGREATLSSAAYILPTCNPFVTAKTSHGNLWSDREPGAVMTLTTDQLRSDLRHHPTSQPLLLLDLFVRVRERGNTPAQGINLHFPFVEP